MDDLLNMKREANDLCEYWYKTWINAKEGSSEIIEANSKLRKAQEWRQLVNDAINAYILAVTYYEK